MSDKSILIVGDSITSKEAGAYISLYPIMLNALPSGTPMIGLGLPISVGNSAVITKNGTGLIGRLDEWENNTPDDPMSKTLDYTVAGHRTGDGPVKVGSGGLLSYGSLHALGIHSMSDMSPAGEDWIAGQASIKMRMNFVRGQTANDWLQYVLLRTCSDFDSSQGANVNGWAGTNIGDVEIAGATDGVTSIEVTHTEPTNYRVGIQTRGPITGGGAASEGLALCLASAYVYDPDEVANPDAYFVDTISVGGWSAEDFAGTLSAKTYQVHFEGMPVAPGSVLIYLGQNTGNNEWNGTVWSETFVTRIETIIGHIRTGASNAGIDEPRIVLVIPQQMDGTYVGSKFDKLRDTYATIAADNGCKVMDMYEAVGGVVGTIDAGYLADAVHPSRDGAEFINSFFWDAYWEAVQEDDAPSSKKKKLKALLALNKGGL